MHIVQNINRTHHNIKNITTTLTVHQLPYSEVGTVIGGTRGNAVLEFVSGSPNKARIQEEAPNIFDYDELIKYGYSHLTTPIMQNGGRQAMYRLMDLPEPATPERLTKKKSAPKLVIDRTGETDRARYSGLKMTQVLDDEVMGQVLQETLTKVKEGKALRQKLEEEDYVMPFAGKICLSFLLRHEEHCSLSI